MESYIKHLARDLKVKTLAKNIRNHLLFFILTIIMTQIVSIKLNSCSTFMLNVGDLRIVGHNLDSMKHKPGLIIVNKRGMLKSSRSWQELAYGKTIPNPSIEWVSKYGSVTFAKYRDFPDGGVNEKGLFIVEMSLAGTKFPVDDKKPAIFMMLWMQYVLDNLDSVDQVIKSAHRFSIDGWSWHFFTADRSGKSAAIEFLDGKIVVHSGEKMPVPVLENSTYTRELERLKEYEGFGGKKKIDLSDKKMPTFVCGAKMLKEYNNKGMGGVEFGFSVLDTFSWEGTQWSYICDLKENKVYFKTKRSTKIKTLNMNKVDFSCTTPVLMLSIHINREGPVKHLMSPYTYDFNKSYIRKNFVAGNYEPVFKRFGSTLKDATKRFADYSENTKCENQ